MVKDTFENYGVKDKLNLERPKIANLIAHSACSGIGGNHYRQNTPSSHTISQPTMSGQRDLQWDLKTYKIHRWYTADTLFPSTWTLGNLSLFGSFNARASSLEPFSRGVESDSPCASFGSSGISSAKYRVTDIQNKRNTCKIQLAKLWHTQSLKGHRTSKKDP